MIFRPAHATGFVLILALGACERPPPPTTADLAVRAGCRQTVEREYAAQNRADLTRSDQRDSAYSASYDPGISTRGLGAEFSRDQMVTDCLRAQGDAADQPSPGVGPAFSPTQRGTGSLKP